MPLDPGSSRAVIERNIHELTHHGSQPRSREQIVAIALANARRHPRSDGGAGPIERALRLARRQLGGGVLPQMPYFERSEARAIAREQPYGLSMGLGGGRTDKNAVSVAANSYVLPADVVAGLGDGNNLAGAKVFDMILHSMPWGIAPEPQRATHRPPPPPHDPALAAGITDSGAAQTTFRGTSFGGSGEYADGGSADKVAIMAADGERILSPEEVLRVGQHYSPKRDLDQYPKTHDRIMRHGHQVLDAFVKAMRGATIKQLKGLRGPVGSREPHRGHT